MNKTQIVSKLREAANRDDLKAMTRMALVAGNHAKQIELDDGSAVQGIEHEYTRISLAAVMDNDPDDIQAMGKFLRTLADDLEQRPEPELSKP